ncbi:MAG: type 4a pilus biogenesis protein PilO [Gammaproteobacteria bacterium]
MQLPELNNLDYRDMGGWPWPIRAVIVVFLSIAISGLGYWFDSRHQLEQMAAAKHSEVELKGVFESKAAKAANLEAYEQQLVEMRASFGAMLRQLPNQTEVADLLVDVSQTGLASGLEFNLFQPRNEVPKEFYAELPIDIEVRGTYHEFGAFISSVAALPRIVTVHGIKIVSDPEGEELTMVLTAKTYRYLDEGEGQEQEEDVQ